MGQQTLPVVQLLLLLFNSTHILEPKRLDDPALIKLKKERDPDKHFQLFKANAYNRLDIENWFAFEGTISRLAGARRFDYIELLLENRKTLPQDWLVGLHILMLYGKGLDE